MEFLSHVVLFTVSMRNYKVLESICDKLKSWGIDPLTLLKAIGIFLIIVVLVILFIKFPVLFGVLLVMLVCIAAIILIYLIIDSYERSDN